MAAEANDSKAFLMSEECKSSANNIGFFVVFDLVGSLIDELMKEVCVP